MKAEEIMTKAEEIMTKAEEIMTANPACCSRETPLSDVAQKMVENDCGCIPVVDEDGKPVGVVTDRDICCRVVATGKNPAELIAADCMTERCVTATPETSLDDCCAVLEENQIRRAVVVDEEGRCCGIVAQADIAKCRRELAGEVVEAVSRRTAGPSRASVPGGGLC